MEYQTTSPIWMQVAIRIKGTIVKGELRPGDKLPGGRELAVQYSINPNTAARVYQELERERICETKRGLGTFVIADEGIVNQLRTEMAGKAMEIYLTSMAELGIDQHQAITMLKEREES